MVTPFNLKKRLRELLSNKKARFKNETSFFYGQLAIQNCL